MHRVPVSSQSDWNRFLPQLRTASAAVDRRRKVGAGIPLGSRTPGGTSPSWHMESAKTHFPPLAGAQQGRLARCRGLKKHFGRGKKRIFSRDAMEMRRRSQLHSAQGETSA